jgi:CRISPR system Cascade subunit CasE
MENQQWEATMPESNDVLAYASVLQLDRRDVQMLRIHDAYALHKVVYGLFEDVRDTSAKMSGQSSGILYADHGGDMHARKILMLSNRKPHQTPQFGTVQTHAVPQDFLNHGCYAFDVIVNPAKRSQQTGKIIAIKERDEVAVWFATRASQSWGFKVNTEHLQVNELCVQSFEKEGIIVTHGSAHLRGELSVTDHDLFKNSFMYGIGRGRAFGFGLLKIVPAI